MHITDFALSRSGDAVVPAHDLSMAAIIQGPRSWAWERKGTLDLQLALATWLGEVFLAFNGEKPAAESFRGNYTMDASVDLEPVSRLLHTSAIMTGDDAMAGDFQLQAAGYLDGRSVEIRELRGEVNGFVLQRKESVFADQNIHLEIRQSVNEDMPSFAIRDLVVTDSREEFLQTGAGFNLISFADQSLFLRNLSLTAETGKMTVEELLVDDWRNPLDTLRVNLDGGFQLGRLGRLLQGLGLLSAGADLAGGGMVAMQARDSAGGGKEIEADIRLTDVSFVWKNREIISREGMSLTAVLHGLPDGSADIRSMRFQSRPLSLTATGTIRREGERQDMELKGERPPDLEKVAAFLRSAFDMKVTMSGGHSEAFQLRFPLTGRSVKDASAMTLTSRLHADQLQYKGLDVRALSMPVSYAANKLRLQASGQLNRGRLEVVADCDFTSEPPVIRMTENSPIMTGVELGNSWLMACCPDIHPLFGDSRAFLPAHVRLDPAGRCGGH